MSLLTSYKQICVRAFPENAYLFKKNNRKTKKKYEICSKLTIKAPIQHQGYRSGVFIINSKYISQVFLVFPLVNWSKYMFFGFFPKAWNFVLQMSEKNYLTYQLNNFYESLQINTNTT